MEDRGSKIEKCGLPERANTPVIVSSSVLKNPAQLQSSTLNPQSSIFDPRSSPPIGLLAGAGRFPIAFAEKARQQDIPVVCVGLRDLASPELIGLTRRFYWTGVAQLGR